MELTYPSAEYPTIVEGIVTGSLLRLESLDGSEMEIPFWGNEFFSSSLYYAQGAFRISHLGPLKIKEKTWGVTHLQKYSPSGYLKVEPDCYHRWHFWESQKKDANGNWMQGTEKGIYFRKSRKLLRFKCWRWDIPGTVLDGVLRHWIPSGGAFGGHWD